MSDRSGKFKGDDPVDIARRWLKEAETSEPNDPNAIALATVDASGMPNVRMVLLKEIEENGFLFYTNYGSVKGSELSATAKASFVIHWKSLRRQIRVRGHVERESGEQADAYFSSRSVNSRLGAWASDQSKPLNSRAELVAQLEKAKKGQGDDPKRPPHWGGFRIVPVEIEFWADGAHRLHDRFRWDRADVGREWGVTRLSP